MYKSHENSTNTIASKRFGSDNKTQ